MPAEVGLLQLDEPSPAQGSSLAIGSDPDGGKSLILTDGSACGECCGACLAYWKANPCGPVTSPYDPCENGPVVPVPPPPIYINPSAQCFGRAIRPGDTVVVDGRCYTVTTERYKRAVDSCAYPPIPPDGRIIEYIEDCAADGCRDPKCIEFTSPFAVAEQCDTSIGYGPPVFFCRRAATRCVYVAASPDGIMPPRCYKISPNAPGGVPGPRSVFIDPLNSTATSCCECTTGLGGDSEIPCFRCVTRRQTQTAGEPIPTTTLTEGPPCCFDRRANCSMTVTGRYFIGDPLGNSELYEIDPQTIPCTGGNVYARITRTENGQTLPPVNQLVEIYQNGGQRMCPPLPPLVGTFQFTNSWTFEIVQDCKGTKVTASSPQSPGLPPTTLTGSVTYNHADGSPPCAGACTGSGPAVAVPYAQWPATAKLVGAFRAEQDRGIGDTIQRDLGWIGEAYKATFLAITGRECGCDARRDLLNLKYPYTNPETAVGGMVPP